MGHGHHHHDTSKMGEKRLWWAVAANVLLTLGQIVGGIVSGSLSLVADALHNLSDAASLFIALIAIRVGRRPADKKKTFGYKRAETVAALVNLTTLIIIGFYLCYEAITRFINPNPIEGWTVVWVASFALVVDVFTALLTFRSSKSSMNFKAVFLHNLTDALASVGVIVAGMVIIKFGWLWADPVMTLVISSYVLFHGFREFPKVVHLLMEGVPEDISVDELVAAIEKVDGVLDVHHVHLWQIDEHRTALEAHVVSEALGGILKQKKQIKELLLEKFNISHSTLEFETESDRC